MMFCFSVIERDYNWIGSEGQRIIYENRNVGIQEYMFIFLKPQATGLYRFDNEMIVLALLLSPLSLEGSSG